jgi:iron-sulfur cluster assembly accessory protein
MNALPEFNPVITREVTVLPAAHAKLVELLQAEPDIQGVRIFVSGGGCSGMSYGMTFAEGPLPSDAILQQDGLTLYVDPVALGFLDGVEIDFSQQGLGASFVFRNAFAATGGSGSCGGCGGAKH